MQVLIHLIYLLKKIIALKVQVAKLDINKSVNTTTDLNNLITKIENLDVEKLKTVPYRFEKSK